METVRTPDERFANLAGYPYAPHYTEVDGLRLHYVDEGPTDGPLVLCMHGEPTWSYLYRTMIPPLVAAGIRVIAPDLIGFGRSDKPVDRAVYTYQRHVDWMTGFLEALDLHDVTLFCQDWGGLIGLRLVAEQAGRFARVIASNTALPTGERPVPEAFFAWRTFSQSVPELTIGPVVVGGCARPVAPAVLAGYEAPFPDERYRAGARQFPMLVPVSPDDPAVPANRAAREKLRRFDRPFLTAFSDGDPVSRGGDADLQALVPGAAGQDHVTIAGAGHFVQEDAGPELAQVLVRFVERTR